MNHSPMAGIAAQGPLPAGMLRIRLGSQERYVWPVHLPGWLGLGWQVAAAGSSPPDGLQPQVVTAPALTRDADPEPSATEKEPEPATARGKRGRRRKEEEPQPSAAAEAHPEDTGTTAEADAADSGAEQQAHADPPAAPDLGAEAAAEPGDDSTADGEVALSALPDDLFSDPLI